jgi:predicted esterase
MVLNIKCMNLYSCHKNDIKIFENPDTEKNLEFLQIQNTLYQYLENGNLQKGLEVSQNLANLFPNKQTLAHSWIATFLEALKRDNDLLDTLEDGFAKGGWWSEQALREGFSGLDAYPRFQKLVEQGREIKSKIERNAEIVVRTPSGYNGEAGLPLLLILHGRYDSNLSFALWDKIADVKEIIVASLQSSQQISGAHFVWDDEEKALEELSLAYKMLLKRYNIDPNRIILAGVSQGTSILMKVLFSEHLTAKGFINVIPAISKFLEWYPGEYSDRIRNLKGYFIAGEKDPRFEKTKSIHEFLVKNGVICKMYSLPQLGHQIPDSHAEIVLKGIEFILK